MKNVRASRNNNIGSKKHGLMKDTAPKRQKAQNGEASETWIGAIRALLSEAYAGPYAARLCLLRNVRGRIKLIDSIFLRNDPLETAKDAWEWQVVQKVLSGYVEDITGDAPIEKWISKIRGMLREDGATHICLLQNYVGLDQGKIRFLDSIEVTSGPLRGDPPAEWRIVEAALGNIWVLAHGVGSL